MVSAAARDAVEGLPPGPAGVCRRIDRRIRELRLPDPGAYQSRLSADPGEWTVLDGLCRITLSRFYRDRRVFDRLSAAILPRLAATAMEDERILRCWCAGCASGEEVYTLRLLWRFRILPRFPNVSLDLLGTDCDPHLLRRSEDGCYARSSLRELPSEWIDRGFTRSGDRYRVKAEFRQGIRFQLQDIRSEQPEGPFDLVLCRNLVFTYLDERSQREILGRIGAHLRPGAVLVLGGHESLPEGEEFGFETVQGGTCSDDDRRGLESSRAGMGR